MAASAQTLPPPADGPAAPAAPGLIQVCQPIEITGLGTEDVQSAAFSPDGSTLYAHVQEPAIDLGALVLGQRLWILGGLLLALTLVTLVRARRVLNRPQSAGVLYCRRCNYDLSGHAQSGSSSTGAPRSPACPECGTTLEGRHIVRGRTRRARLVWTAGAWVVLTGLFAGAATPRVARRAAPAIEGWTSTALARLATDRGWTSLQRRIRNFDRVVIVDVKTERAVRTLFRRSCTSYTDIAISPDGRLLIMNGPGDTAAAYSTSTGRRVRSVALPGNRQYEITAATVCGWSNDGSTAFIPWFDRGTAVGGVVAWNLLTGTSPVLFSTPGYKDPDRPWGWGRQFLRLGNAEPARFVSWPSFMEAFPTKTFVLRYHAPGLPDREFSPSPKPEWQSRPAASPDGTTLYVPTQPFGLSAFDTRTDERLGTLPTLNSINHPLALDGAGRRLVMAGQPIQVRDVIDRRWVARLDLPPGLYAPKPAISKDGRTIAAACQGPRRTPATPGSFTHELILWKLDEPGTP